MENTLDNSVSVVAVPNIVAKPENIQVFKNVISKILGNKLYLIILIIVVVLIIAGLILYKYYYNKINMKLKLPFLSKETSKNNLLNLTEEYHIIDPDGEKILVTPYLIEILKQHYNQSQNKLQNQLHNQPQHQPQKQPQKPLPVTGKENPRPKLIHPVIDPPSEVQLSENHDSVNNDLSKDEIDALKKELAEMQQKYDSQGTENNDNDDE